MIYLISTKLAALVHNHCEACTEIYGIPCDSAYSRSACRINVMSSKLGEQQLNQLASLGPQNINLARQRGNQCFYSSSAL